jgi:hypothetical protein
VADHSNARGPQDPRLLRWQYRMVTLANKLRRSGWVRLVEIAGPLRHTIPPPGNEQQLQEKFFAALLGGAFNRAGRTRVFLLNESRPSPLLRLTPERARDAVHSVGWDVFARDYLGHAWVETEPIYDLIAIWLGSLRVVGLRNPMIDLSLHELSTLVSPAPSAPSISGTPSLVNQQPGETASEPAATRPGVRLTPQVRAEAEWERRLRALVESGEQPKTRTATLTLARKEFGSGILSDKAFGRVWDKLATPEMKKPGPRGPRTHKR